jgi:hypothetical protein
VLLRNERERLDVEAAIEELRRSSFVELRVSPEDRNVFVTVPLVAAIFAKRKLAVSELKTIIAADNELLRSFGAAQPSDVGRGVHHRIQRLFGNVANRLGSVGERLDSYIPMLEFIASKHPPAWLLLADLLDESSIDGATERAKVAVRRYLESGADAPSRRVAWERLAILCRRTEDWLGEIHAVVEAAAEPQATVRTMSNAINRLNLIFKTHAVLDSHEKEALLRRVLDAIQPRLNEADATDYSRLAWLALHLGDEALARRYTSQGLRSDGYHDHCVKLARKLGLL